MSIGMDEPVAQNSWTLAFFLGLMTARLGSFHSGMDGDKTWSPGVSHLFQPQ